MQVGIASPDHIVNVPSFFSEAIIGQDRNAGMLTFELKPARLVTTPFRKLPCDLKSA
jgi:hypothetical protein